MNKLTGNRDAVESAPFIVSFAIVSNGFPVQEDNLEDSYSRVLECRVLGGGQLVIENPTHAFYQTGSTFTKAMEDPTRDEATDQ